VCIEKHETLHVLLEVDRDSIGFEEPGKSWQNVKKSL
jgi:hypothetical protein